jgi:putative oxidoreductase
MTTDFSSTETKTGFTRFLPAIARVLMGLPLTLFGLNAFFPFIPQPKEAMPEAIMAFVGALMNSGYMMQLIGATLLTVGVLLLVNRFVPLALALFAPFIVNSLAFHVFLARSGYVMPLVFLAFELYLAWCYRHAFAPMLAAKVRPA